MSADASSGEESNDMIINQADIEEIDRKLTAKRKQKQAGSPNRTKKSRLIEEMQNSPQLKIVLKKDLKQLKSTEDVGKVIEKERDNNVLEVKKKDLKQLKSTEDVGKVIEKERDNNVLEVKSTEGMGTVIKIKTDKNVLERKSDEDVGKKERDNDVPEVKTTEDMGKVIKKGTENNVLKVVTDETNHEKPNEILKVGSPLKKQEEISKKDIIAEERRQRQEEKELYKLLVEQEKLYKQKLKEQKRLEKEAMEEERRQAREQRLEERIIADEREKEERRIREERRKAEMEKAKIDRAEKKKQLEEEAALKRREKALKGMKYLLSVSEKYSEFYKDKLPTDTKSNKPTGGKPLQERNKFLPTVDDMKEAVKVGGRKSEVKEKTDITRELKYFENGTLHPYQVEGVTWLKVLYDNGINGILADEMGLGKTVQVIALICHLLEKGTAGPYLIIVPLSTLPNWTSEFERFAPKVPTVVFYGNEQERRSLYGEVKKKYTIGDLTTYPVILTSYQVPMLEENFLRRLKYQYVVVDEGHKIKNHETKLSVILRSLNSSNRLLLTGTPLQNNITELWALLNFLMPHLFTNMDTFASLLMLEDMEDENKLIEQEEKNNVIHTLHRVLAPFMLRRLKKDVLLDLVPKKDVIVYCPMSKLQKTLYTSVIEKNIKQLQMKEEEEIIDLDMPRPKRKIVPRRRYDLFQDDSTSDFSEFEDENEVPVKEFKPFMIRLTMQNSVVMFRKIVDHPYLVHFPLDPDAPKKSLLVNEDLVTSSGKMMVLDALLDKLKKTGHKVLIFSTLVMTLDLIEELLIMRNHRFCRIDGSISLEDRGDNIDEFNKDPDVLAFLLSTRAGGLGLNLTGADTCIFFDRDWNPQADIQAEARCHRIGQTRPVMVYTLVAKNTIDEKIITCGYQKRLLEKLVIKDGKFKSMKSEDKTKTENTLNELKELINSDANKPFEEEFSNEVLEKLLDRSELYEIMKNMKK